MMVLVALGLGAMRGDTDCPNTGPDVLVSDIYDTMTWGTLNGEIAFSIGTNACNIGDEVLNWIGYTADHPVIAQSLYRIRNGRIEQIGTAWLKHGFGAAQVPGCGCTCVPADYEHLGVGCSDAYGATINGVQSGLGPRLEVNPYTGEFPFPPSGWGETGTVVERRLRTAIANIDPALDGGGVYLVEAQYVSMRDAEANNAANSVSWRTCEFSSVGSSWQMNLTGVTEQGMTAVEGWGELDPDVVVNRVDVPGDGQIVVATRVNEIRPGWYRYVLAVQNITCARGLGGISIDISPAATVAAPEFLCTELHGEAIDNVDWDYLHANSNVSWSTDAFEENPTANAIRWGTTYTYTFETNIPPIDGDVKIGLFEPGEGATVSVPGIVPTPEPLDPCDLATGPCPWELDGNAGVGGGDLTVLLGSWGTCGDGSFRPLGDLDGDCCVDGADLTVLLGSWGEDCTSKGACCLDDGTCADDMTETECTLAGGIYRGDYSVCVGENCPQPGACCMPDASCVDGMFDFECYAEGGVFSAVGGCAEARCLPGADECEDAVPIEEGVHSYSTLNATTGGQIHPECETGGDGGIVGHDIWFIYVPAEDGSLHLSTCNTADYDTEILIYAGDDCASAELVGCNDDADGCAGYSSDLTVSVDSDSAYLIRLGGWREGSLGTGQFLVEFLPGSEFADDCADAIWIEEGVHAFSTIGATTDGPIHPECKLFDRGVTGNDIWFVYTATGTGMLEVSTCNLVDYDSDLVIYDGVDCEDLVLLGCNDDAADCAKFSSRVVVPVLEGDSYLIRVGGWQIGHVGTGEILVHLESR
jgi:hypothetical protein